MSATDGPKKILIVDDDPGVAEMLREYFEQTPRDFVVQTATNGSDAIASVRRDAPDLILLDITMPGMNGLEVLRQILSIDRGIAVMMVTGNADSAPTDALRLGAFAYLPKPVDFAYLDQLVPLALDRRRPPKPRFGDSTSDC